MLPSLVCAALHLVLLFQFLFYFNSCRFCGQPPHISVGSQCFKVGRCNIASPDVAFADIFIPESWSTSGSLASGEFTILNIFWCPSILHAGYVDKLAKSSLRQYSEHSGDSSPFKDFIVGDVWLPGDIQNLPDASEVEGVQSLFLSGVRSPALNSEHESTENTSLIHCDLGLGRELGIFPHSSG